MRRPSAPSGLLARCSPAMYRRGHSPTGDADTMAKNSSQSLSDQLKPFVAPFRIDGSGEFHLKSHNTGEKGGLDKEQAEKILEANRKRLNEFQEKLYAQDRWSLLLVFQGMDAAGKDTAIKSVFDGVNPQGCEVHILQAADVATNSITTSCGARRRAAGARPHRHLQPLLLRGMPGGAGAPGDSRQAENPTEAGRPRTSGANGSRIFPLSSATSRATAP